MNIHVLKPVLFFKCELLLIHLNQFTGMMGARPTPAYTDDKTTHTIHFTRMITPKNI